MAVTLRGKTIITTNKTGSEPDGYTSLLMTYKDNARNSDVARSGYRQPALDLTRKTEGKARRSRCNGKR